MKISKGSTKTSWRSTYYLRTCMESFHCISSFFSSPLPNPNSRSKRKEEAFALAGKEGGAWGLVLSAASGRYPDRSKGKKREKGERGGGCMGSIRSDVSLSKKGRKGLCSLKRMSQKKRHLLFFLLGCCRWCQSIIFQKEGGRPNQKTWKGREKTN